jgi:predicted amidohydrolase YtcJ
MPRTLRFLAILLFVSCASSRPGPDLILSGGRVFTSDDAKPWAEAVAIKGDRIVAVGSTAEIQKLAGKATRTIALGGKVVIPGINDAHVHVPGGLDVTHIAVPDNASMNQLLERLEQEARRLPHGEWLYAEVPPALTDDSRLMRETLDTVSRNHPIILAISGGHAAVLNNTALRVFGIREDQPDTAGGSYGRTGERLNGWLYEHAFWSALARVEYRDTAALAALRRFSDEVVRYGITSAQSMPVIGVERAAALAAQSATPIRWRFIELQMARVNDAPRNAVKYIIDGTPIERGAAMSGEYADRRGQRGRINYSEGEIRRMFEAAARGGQPLLLHVSGDRAADTVFAAMKSVRADWPRQRVRIEHGDSLDAENIADAARLGVIVVQNPAHFAVPQILATRYRPQFVATLQPFRTLMDRGVHVAIGSDGPINPYLNIMFASLHPANPSEKATREQAVIAYTRGSAVAEFKEREKGTIAPGMLADLAVLSQDIFNVPAQELPKTSSVMTIIGGKVVWEVR